MSDRHLLDFYSGLGEKQRLGLREGQLEFLRTKELLELYIPPPPAKIIDVGGGTGAYAKWLASAGYAVHLVDIVPAHVEEALTGGLFTAVVGDARALSDADATYDVALLLGPLYHLQEASDRCEALREAGRVVRPGGVVVAAFISRAVAALDGYVKGWIDKLGAVEIMKDQVQHGFHPSDQARFSTVSYFHLPSEARREVAASGLKLTGMFGVEGPGWVAPDFDFRWEHADTRNALLESARVCEQDPELQVLSPHLLAFCRRG